MKTAVIYCGQARTFSQVWPNHVWRVLRHLENPDFFVSVADDEQAPDMFMLQPCFPESRFEFEKVRQPHIPEYPDRTKWHAGWGRSVPQQGVLKQLWALNRAWEFFESRANVSDYKTVVRIRPDSAFTRAMLPSITAPHLAYTPWWGKFGGCNDRFAILGTTAAHAYFTTFQRLQYLYDKFCPIHPETLIEASLNDMKCISISGLDASFLTIRMNGDAVEPCASAEEIALFAQPY